MASSLRSGFTSLNLGSSPRQQQQSQQSSLQSRHSTHGAPSTNTSTRPGQHQQTSNPPARQYSDPYANLDSWSAAGGTALRGTGPARETAGLQDLPLPPPDYQSALRDSQLYESEPNPTPSASNRPAPAQPSSPPKSPPARSGTTAAAGSGARDSVRRRQSVEDPLAALARYDVVFLVDDSPSMDNGSSWEDLRSALLGVVQKCAQYVRASSSSGVAVGGVSVHFLNNEQVSLSNVTDTSEVSHLWETIRPFGSTPTAMRLDDILRPYVDTCEDAKASRTSGGPRIEMPKPMILVIVTDGRADDPDLIKDCIVEFAGRLDDIRAPAFQLGVQFLQIGDDPDASAFLKELDDDIKAEASVRDMVDTVPFTGRFTAEFLTSCLLGSVNRRIDGRN